MSAFPTEEDIAELMLVAGDCVCCVSADRLIIWGQALVAPLCLEQDGVNWVASSDPDVHVILGAYVWYVTLDVMGTPRTYDMYTPYGGTAFDDPANPRGLYGWYDPDMMSYDYVEVDYLVNSPHAFCE